MARTLDLLAQLKIEEDGREETVPERNTTGSAVNFFLQQVIELATTTSNQQITYPAGFTTATTVFLMGKAADGTFTVSQDSTNAHHLVNSGGMYLIQGDTTALYISNNSTTATPEVTVVLVG